MTDRVNGRLNPADLARMALDVGYNPIAKKFAPCVVLTDTPTVYADPIDKKMQTIADEKAVAPKKVEPAKETALIPDDENKPFSVSDTVNVLKDDEIVPGTIKFIHKTDDEYKYEVEFAGGEVITVTEDEIEVANG